ncbi:hypothetical protein EDD18DRAFT_431558 [Armillaria luteobubalina]|uniref:Uncharacterized protein n=1 Tax=Armillaria luteobubalina TaxID=153913 RepID=A0AA39PYW5_9AGAR|nr:hypothetical protein EDD18DRAFT_431558 [Armillaria luteobubalina]
MFAVRPRLFPRHRSFIPSASLAIAHHTPWCRPNVQDKPTHLSLPANARGADVKFTNRSRRKIGLDGDLTEIKECPCGLLIVGEDSRLRVPALRCTQAGPKVNLDCVRATFAKASMLGEPGAVQAIMADMEGGRNTGCFIGRGDWSGYALFYFFPLLP